MGNGVAIRFQGLSALLDILPYMLIGMVGIFVVVLVIIAFTYGLTILSTLIDRKLKKRKQ